MVNSMQDTLEMQPCVEKYGLVTHVANNWPPEPTAVTLWCKHASL